MIKTGRSIQDLDAELMRAEILSDDELEKLRRARRKKVLDDFLAAERDRFHQEVVVTPQGAYDLAVRAGNEPGGFPLYWCGTLLKGTGNSEEPLRLEEYLPYTALNVACVTSALAHQIGAPVIKVYPGFFPLRYTQKWAVGGEEDEPTTIKGVVRNISAWDAVYHFLGNWRPYGGYHLLDLAIYFNERWHEVKFDLLQPHAAPFEIR